MTKLFFLFATVLMVSTSQAQTDSSASKQQPESAPAPVKMKKFNVALRTMSKKNLYGQIYAVNDSQILLRRYTGETYEIPAENIQSFTMKRKNSVLKGGLIGFGVGMLTGVIIGLASGDDKLEEPSINDFGISAAINNAFAMTAGEKAALNGIALGTSGAIAGMIIGAIAKKKFTIGGHKQKFRDLQAELMAKLVRK